MPSIWKLLKLLGEKKDREPGTATRSLEYNSLEYSFWCLNMHDAVNYNHLMLLTVFLLESWRV